MHATLADAWLHDLSPFAIEFGPGFGVRWYGLAYLAGFVAAYLLMRAMARRGLILIPAHRCGDVMLTVIVGVVVGGRVGYVLLYEPSLLWDFSAQAPWWGVLAINKGGMASHGGIVGVILAAWRVSRGWKCEGGGVEGRCPPMHVMDVFALLAPIGLGLGRLANFVNGELLGRVVAAPGSTAPWWSVRFPQEVVSGHAAGRSPAQDRALSDLVHAHALPDEPFEASYSHVLEILRRGGEEGRAIATELAPLISARHPSQLYQFLAEGVVLGAVLAAVWARPRKPGVVGAWFLITYGALRVTTEIWRLPDAHLDVARWLGLSRGQWFSVLMVVAGVAVLAWASRSRASRVGGWASSARSRPTAEPPREPIQSAPHE